MPFIPAPGVIQINMNAFWRNIAVANVLYIRKPTATAWSLSEMDAAIAVVLQWWRNTLMSEQSPEYVLDNVKATDLFSDSASTSLIVAGTPNTGTNTGESVQNTNALCVTFNTAGRGRSARGRNYVAGLLQSNLVDNHWDAGVCANVEAHYEVLGDDLGTSSLTHVVLSRYTGGNPRVTALAQPVTSYNITSNLVATQRNRRD
jgi:hypothetical protein